jgi:tripartite-type tricarboxylate transporter receptor subunit TctC
MQEQRRRAIAQILGAAAASTPLCGWADPLGSGAVVRLVVPFAPGGTTDIIARTVADKLSEALKRRVVVENKSGSGGLVGAMDVIRSAPDGATLGIATVSTTATNPAINPNTQYHPVTDFTPIINIALTPNVIAVHPSFPARDYRSFLAKLKQNPGKYTYASSGTGGIGHMMTELFKALTGTFITHIGYRGAGPALLDTVAGHNQIIFDNLPSALPFIRDGRLRPIVVASPTRVASLPTVPTFAEVGLGPVNRTAYYGILGPRGMSKALVDHINAAVKTTLADPAIRKRIEETGSVVIGGSPAEFAAQIKDEYETYARLVKERGLSL